MNIKQCQFCKKPFASLGGRICPACLEQIDLDFIKVRDYIYDNKHANIEDISEETEVSKPIIIHLIKEGRLIIDSPDGAGGGLIACEICRKPIKTGRMCDECKNKLTKTIDSKAAPSKPETKTSAAEQNLKATAKIGK